MSKKAAFIGKSEGPEPYNLRFASRHGLIAGATADRPARADKVRRGPRKLAPKAAARRR